MGDSSLESQVELTEVIMRDFITDSECSSSSSSINSVSDDSENAREQAYEERLALEKRKKETFDKQMEELREKHGDKLNPAMATLLKSRINREIDQEVRNTQKAEQERTRTVSFHLRNESQQQDLDISVMSQDMDKTVADLYDEKQVAYTSKEVQKLINAAYMLDENLKTIEYCASTKRAIQKMAHKKQKSVSNAKKLLLSLASLSAEELSFTQTLRPVAKVTSAWKREMTKLDKQFMANPTLEDLIFLGRIINSDKCHMLQAERVFGYTLETVLINMYLQRLHISLVEGTVLGQMGASKGSYCWLGRIDTIPQPTQMNLKVIMLIIPSLLASVQKWDNEYRETVREHGPISDEAESRTARDQLLGHILDTIGTMLVRLLDCINIMLFHPEVVRCHMLSITKDILEKRMNQMQNYYAQVALHFKPFLLRGHTHRKQLITTFIKLEAQYKNIKQHISEQHFTDARKSLSSDKIIVIK